MTTKPILLNCFHKVVPIGVSLHLSSPSIENRILDGDNPLVTFFRSHPHKPLYLLPVHPPPFDTVSIMGFSHSNFPPMSVDTHSPGHSPGRIGDYDRWIYLQFPDHLRPPPTPHNGKGGVGLIEVGGGGSFSQRGGLVIMGLMVVFNKNLFLTLKFFCKTFFLNFLFFTFRQHCPFGVIERTITLS